MTIKVMHINFHGQIDVVRAGTNKVIRTLAKHSTRVQIVCAGLSKHSREHMFDGIPCIDFVEDTVRNRIFNKTFRLGVYTFSDLSRAINTARPDIIHFHTRPELVDPTFNRLRYRPKVVFHYHRHYIDPAVPESACLLLAISNGVKHSVTEISRTTKSFEVLHNPLPEGIPAAVDTPMRCSREPVIFFAGGNGANKGFPELILACRFAYSQGYAFRLQLAGEGLEHYELPPEINVEILGYLSPEHYYSRLQETDIFVMPSKREGFGLAALEALHFAKLVIGSDVPGLNEVISADRAILFDPNRPNALSETLVAVLRKWQTDPHQFDALRIAGQMFSRKFAPDPIAARLCDLYASL